MAYPDDSNSVPPDVASQADTVWADGLSVALPR